ncbi:hypothetical protein SPONN_1019 [uncultured Candidatus Thioglobus sp.]|nr:hypothetical protein SPONN_1019 [uncultured Candidatus Thioglobus sp.]
MHPLVCMVMPANFLTSLIFLSILQQVILFLQQQVLFFSQLDLIVSQQVLFVSQQVLFVSQQVLFVLLVRLLLHMALFHYQECRISMTCLPNFLLNISNLVLSFFNFLHSFFNFLHNFFNFLLNFFNFLLNFPHRLNTYTPLTFLNSVHPRRHDIDLAVCK